MATTRVAGLNKLVMLWLNLTILGGRGCGGNNIALVDGLSLTFRWRGLEFCILVDSQRQRSRPVLRSSACGIIVPLLVSL